MTKSKKIKSAELVGEIESAFQCPYCGSSMKVVDVKSFICTQNHTFDFAKQGYLNLMTHPTTSQYSKELFEARQKTIVETGLYNPLHHTISQLIRKHIDVTASYVTLLDTGCGEGSHLHKIMDECGSPTMTGIGLDIAKEGIVMAAKNYDNSIWIVGDLAQSPFQDKSMHVILNILSPSNYKEFKRVLTPHGIVIKVLPRSNYLIELREGLFEPGKNQDYQNDKTVALFKEHFQLLDAVTLTYTKKLSQSELYHVVHMTPLAWSSENERVKTFTSKESAEITIGLEILVGVM